MMPPGGDPAHRLKAYSPKSLEKRSEKPRTRLQRSCRPPVAPGRGDLIAVVAPMCIKELRLVTGQLPEKSGLIGPGHKRTSPVRGYKKFARGRLEPDAADAGGRLTSPSQGRQDVLGATVLAFRE